MIIVLTDSQAKRLANVLDYVMGSEFENYQEFMAENDNPEGHIFWQAEALYYQLGFHQAAVQAASNTVAKVAP